MFVKLEKKCFQGRSWNTKLDSYVLKLISKWMLESFQFQSMDELGTDVVKLSFQNFETVTVFDGMVCRHSQRLLHKLRN